MKGLGQVSDLGSEGGGDLMELGGKLEGKIGG